MKLGIYYNLSHLQAHLENIQSMKIRSVMQLENDFIFQKMMNFTFED